MDPASPLWVVKLGGSLLDAPELVTWLRVLARAPGPARVVVPGGGSFADAVRRAQAKLGFDDRTADRMALLAMNQYGLMLTGLEPALIPVDRIQNLRAPREAGRVPVWLPYPAIAECCDLEASWDVTSDSIALWLARALGATRLVLVKSAPLPPAPARVEELVEAGILDRAFAGLASGYAGDISCMGRGAHGLFAQALQGEERLSPVRHGPAA